VTPLRYVLNLLKLASVVFNVVFLFSSRVETLSRRAGVARNEGRRWGCVLCAIVNPIFRVLVGQDDHCGDSVRAGHILKRDEVI
jgi:hypothetical protein